MRSPAALTDDYDYDYGYTDENLYAQGEDVTYGQDEYTEQTNNY